MIILGERKDGWTNYWMIRIMLINLAQYLWKETLFTCFWRNNVIKHIYNYITAQYQYKLYHLTDYYRILRSYTIWHLNSNLYTHFKITHKPEKSGGIASIIYHLYVLCRLCFYQYFALRNIKWLIVYEK